MSCEEMVHIKASGSQGIVFYLTLLKSEKEEKLIEFAVERRGKIIVEADEKEARVYSKHIKRNILEEINKKYKGKLIELNEQFLIDLLDEIKDRKIEKLKGAVKEVKKEIVDVGVYCEGDEIDFEDYYMPDEIVF